MDQITQQLSNSSNILIPAAIAALIIMLIIIALDYIFRGSANKQDAIFLAIAIIIAVIINNKISN